MQNDASVHAHVYTCDHVQMYVCVRAQCTYSIPYGDWMTLDGRRLIYILSSANGNSSQRIHVLSHLFARLRFLSRGDGIVVTFVLHINSNCVSDLRDGQG